MRRRFALPIVLMGFVAGCATPAHMERPSGSLVGAWIVTSARSGGVGKNLLTFSSDGTFFRSGDTHPTLSGGHGAWKLVGPGEYLATYRAFRFDENRKWIGSTKTTLRVKLGASADEFTGTAKSVTLDLDDKPIREGGSRLEGRRIVVESE